MNKKFFLLIIFLLSFTVFSFIVHKFYVSIYQVNYSIKNKRIEITSRIFKDDLNAALSLNLEKKTNLGNPLESDYDTNMMKNYFQKQLMIKVNNLPQKMIFVTKEVEGDVLILYFKINNIKKIKTLEIVNTALLEFNNEQQNIMQFNIHNKKQNLIITKENTKIYLKV